MPGEARPIDRPAPGAITGQFKRAPAPDYLSGLNDEQRDAVLTIDGPLLVLAGAGTGKTRVLTTRIAHIINTNRAWPSQILSVTFTNKAAREMKERIEKLVPRLESMPWMGTFHSIGARILRAHAELVDLKSTFTILDTDDQIRLIKQLLDAENIDEKRWPARQFAGMLDNWKNKGLLPRDVTPSEAGIYANGRAGKLYADYQARLKSLNAADFGDLLLECIRLFKENPDVLAEYHRKFKYMLVDEYQDSNVAQYLWLRLLAQGKPASEANICVVGDDDQSIYGWRGAEVDNILRFEKDFPGAKVVKLERNYRSTSNILKAASNLIAFNESRLGKTLQTDVGEKGELVSVTQFWDSEEEARTIGEDIEQYQRQGEDLNSMAILVRASFQMREFEERFITLGLNYRVIGGPRFYERKEIRDALAYLRLVAQPADDLAFERIINVPKRGIGDTTVKMLMSTARHQNMPLLAATRLLLETEELKAKQRTTLRSLIGQFDDWAVQVPDAQALRTGRADPRRERLYRYAQRRKVAGIRGPQGKPQGIEPRHGGIRHPRRLPRTHCPGHGPRQRRSQRRRHHHDPAWRQGTGIQHRLPARLGGRHVPQPALDGRKRPRRLGGRTAPRLCGHHPRPQARAHFRRPEPPHPRPLAIRHPLALPRRTPRRRRRGQGHRLVLWRLRLWRRRRVPLQQGRPVRKRLRNPRLAARPRPAGPRKGGGPLTIEGDLVARSVDLGGGSAFSLGERVFHLKFGYGAISGIEGNKLTIDFEKAGRKKVLDSFIKKA